MGLHEAAQRKTLADYSSHPNGMERRLGVRDSNELLKPALNEAGFLFPSSFKAFKSMEEK
jgi:hypothetical protein